MTGKNIIKAMLLSAFCLSLPQVAYAADTETATPVSETDSSASENAAPVVKASKKKGRGGAHHGGGKGPKAERGAPQSGKHHKGGHGKGQHKPEPVHELVDPDKIAAELERCQELLAAPAKKGKKDKNERKRCQAFVAKHGEAASTADTPTSAVETPAT